MIINLISSPRNISTALMYAFAQRMDTKVVDEPFYAYYLYESGADHPGREEILKSMPVSLKEIQEQINGMASKHPIVFIKNMAHHLIDMDISFLKDYTNVFLIREPKQLIASFSKVIEKPTMRDVGIQRQKELFDLLSKEEDCPVVDSHELLKNPEYVLNGLCQAIGIPFEPAMLSWKSGPIKEDGIWAKFWYENVHQSTGFELQKINTRSLPAHCEWLYRESKPIYDVMFEKSIKADKP